MTRTEYDELKALNYSGAKEIIKSPAHYQAWLKSEKEETPALKFGRLVHLASLEPLVFDKQVRVMPDCDRRTTAGKAIYAAFEATLKPDEEAIKQEEMNKVLAVAESAQAGIEAVMGFFDIETGDIIGKDGVRLTEHTFTADFEGVKIKGRPDLVVNRVGGSSFVIDVKTTTDASAKNFAKEIWNYKYFLQAAWYLRLTGAKTFYFVAVEKEPPYAHAIYKLDDAAIEMGQELMSSACITYRECANFGAWPSYPQYVQTLSLPKWANSDSLDA